MEVKDGFKCVICEKWTLGWGNRKQYGNNPHPIMNHGECCNDCNLLVIKARLNAVKKEDVK